MKVISRALLLILLSTMFACRHNDRSSSERIDPIESDPKYSKILEEVELKTEQHPDYLKYKGQMGSCHVYWRIKKEILKNDYNIKWKSPAELNPHCLYD